MSRAFHVSITKPVINLCLVNNVWNYSQNEVGEIILRKRHRVTRAMTKGDEHGCTVNPDEKFSVHSRLPRKCSSLHYYSTDPGPHYSFGLCVHGKSFIWRSRSWFSVSWPLLPVGVHFEMTTSLSRVSCGRQA